jgi:hypothetical protein
MWELQHRVRALISGLLTRRRSGRRVCAGPGADWLPPVFGPSEWSIGMMVDRSAGWYFDRN